ncbi:MAG: hypothetical protein JO284_01035 [Planctomycetaceae bacterium]|jgi:hypothetical protein|nr:hypothetical protein [Planctomycetaceae bacterium]MBV8606373.1 hypothetical protein [Singulisphaera sp.]MBV8229383.1 hypothetical protein [Planctomycetaceae bacterium]MBV8265636.1 hypothetical protein [Planctomycetaceae bacterium]MBV8317425.1 hypothetical protein [Planctomycetaceae bacterium]
MEAKKKRGRPAKPVQLRAIKIDRTLVPMLQVVATRRGVPMSELLSDFARRPIEKAYFTVMHEIQEEAKKMEEVGASKEVEA